MTVKIFDEPIKTTAYLSDMDIDDILGDTFKALMIIRQKYDRDNEWEYLIEPIENGFLSGMNCSWIWECDWNEGQQNVELLGWMDDITYLSNSEIETLYNFLKSINRKDDVNG